MSEKSSQEMLENLRAIIAQEMIEKPRRREKAVADPALWRAIECHQKRSGYLWDGQLAVAATQISGGNK